MPRWEATRYAVEEIPVYTSTTEREDSFSLCLYDCRTGERLLEVNYYDSKTGKKLPASPCHATWPKHFRSVSEPILGREAEVARLCRGIEQLMRGEAFSFM